MADLKALELGCQATGITSQVPQLVVHQCALTLRQLFDAGTPPEDPRCAALIQLVNSARLLLLPNSNNAANTASSLALRAVHIDVSTATVAAIMGLNNASQLTGAAVAEANRARARTSVRRTSSNDPGLKLRLNPKLSSQAFQSLVHLVSTDQQLGERALKDMEYKSSSMTQKMNRLRAGQRHASVRKRRLVSDDYTITADERRDQTLTQPEHVPPPSSSLSTPPPLPPPPPVPIVPLNVTPGMNAFQPVAYPPQSRAVSLGRTPGIVHTAPRSFAPPSMAPSSFQRIDGRATFSRRISFGASDSQNPPFSRYRARQPDEHVQNKRLQQALAKDKGVMNDQIRTPDEVMEAFLKSGVRENDDPFASLNNGGKIRSILTERERVLYRLLKRRRAELAAMPLGMTEQTRRNAIIEAKQLSLLELQRVVRFRVCSEMKKMHSLAIQDEGCVPADHLSRLFRRRDPPIYSYTDGYPRITPFDGIPEMPQRHPSTVAQDSIRMAQFDRSRMAAKAVQAKNEYRNRFMVHFSNFKNQIQYAKSGRAQIWRGIERYLLEKKRAEERKRKLERIERLRLLRSNDEQAYFKLLKNTKNERLLQLVRQTDSYLMRIGAQVESQRDQNHTSTEPQNAFSEELHEGAVPIESMRRRRDMYYTVTHAVQEEVRQPSIMVNGTLKSYQVDGLKWMVSLYNNNLNGILADEMGLGKTIQTISLITYLVEAKKNPGPFLIIVPLSTMGNWVRELELWAPSLVKVAYRGNKATRRTLQAQMAARDFNVLLTTYEFTVKDQHILSRIMWKYIIIDEGHRMKNADCKLAMTLGIKYKSRNRLLLTGTPLQNNLTELWALLNFLLPSIFSSSDTFETWFKQPFESTTLGDTAELEEEERLLVINRLHQVLRPFLLRRLKTDVETQLPSKVEHVVHCDMSSWQRVIYRQVKDRIGLATGVHNGGVKSFNNLLMQCKKICNHPYLFYDPEAIDFLPQDHLIRASGKFCLLQHMLPKLKMNNHRTLIFSQMTAALDYLEYFLSAIGVEYLRLDGNTRADDRQELLNQFNAKDSPYFCFLLSTRAGGLGLNLQTADTVIIFDSDWNPMMDLQAQDRAHRIGQTRVVTVYRLICAGTVEVKILDQANRKLQVDAQVIQAGQFNNQSTENDRHQMLKDILRQKNDEDSLGDVPSMEELNRLFARSEDEFEKYVAYDKASLEDGTLKPLFTREDEVPGWVLQPDVDHKTAEEKEQETLMSHGRGRRKRKTTHDMDLLTEAEWFKVVEGDMSVEEAFEKRRLRKEKRKDGSGDKAGNEGAETEDENGIDPSTDEAKGPSEEPDLSSSDVEEVGEDQFISDNSDPQKTELLKGTKMKKSELGVEVQSFNPGLSSERLQRSGRRGIGDGICTGKGITRRRPQRTGTVGGRASMKQNAMTDKVVVKVRIRAPVSLNGQNDDDSALQNADKAKQRNDTLDGESASINIVDNESSPPRRKKRKLESVAENPLARKVDKNSKSARKPARRSKVRRKDTGRSRSDGSEAVEKAQDSRRDGVLTEKSEEPNAGPQAPSQLDHESGKSVPLPEQIANGAAIHENLSDLTSSTASKRTRTRSLRTTSSRKRPKINIIPPEQPRNQSEEFGKGTSDANSSDVNANTNGSIPRSNSLGHEAVFLKLRIRREPGRGTHTAERKSARRRTTRKRASRS